MSALRTLGTSDLSITAIGIGAWAMGGGGWQYAWGHQDDADSIAAIRAGLAAGMNWIDTAAVYGLGHSEEIVGKAVKELPQKPYIFTKCERIWDEQGKISGSLKAESVRRECEASLGRLGLEQIDLYQVHWPEPDAEIEEGWRMMEQLQKEGKVRYIGVSNFNVAQMKRSQAIAPIVSLQPPYSLLARQAEPETLPYALQNNIGVIVYSPMRAGLLSGKMTAERARNFPDDDWRRNDKDFQEPRLARNLQLVERLRAIGDRHGRTPGETAIAWTLHNPAITGAIVGLRDASQVEGVRGALDFRLTESEATEIEQCADQTHGAASSS